MNRTPNPAAAEASLKIEGNARAVAEAGPQQISVLAPAQNEARASWPIVATSEGTATFELVARSGADGDGMALTLPVLPDGFIQETTSSAMLAANAAMQAFTLTLPQPFDASRSKVGLALSIGSLDAVLDAVPYLIDYPYGCVEQTMSRFLPAVIAKKTLRDLGISAEAIERRILIGESRSNGRRRAKTAGIAKLDDVLEQCLARLDKAGAEGVYGGYGWWPGQQSGDPWMTAYVAWGLSLAREAGCKIPADLIPAEEIGANASKLASADDRLPWTLVAGARVVQFTDSFRRSRISSELKDGFKRAFAVRDQIGPAGRACLALAAATFGEADEQLVLLRNLENGAKRGTTNNAYATVHWGATSDYWRAMDGAVESTALTALALLELDPKHDLIEPAVRWLKLNRASGRWSNTRDTAFALLALTRHIAVCGLAKSSVEVTAFVNGQTIGRVNLDLEAALAGPTVLDVAPGALHGGENRVELKRTGGNADVVAVATASSWSDYETTHPAGHFAAVTRKFVRQKSQPTVAGNVRFVPESLQSAPAAIGEQVSVVVSLEVPNALEYVMVCVPKPAGCEPLNPLSGWDARLSPESKHQGMAPDEGRALYREEHDRSVFFIDYLAAGRWDLRFGLRATTPGNFRAAPATVEAMYVSSIRGNSEATRVKIRGPGEPDLAHGP